MYAKWSKGTIYEIVLWCACSRKFSVRALSRICAFCGEIVILSLWFARLVVIVDSGRFANILFIRFSPWIRCRLLNYIKAWRVRKCYLCIQVRARQNQVHVVAYSVMGPSTTCSSPQVSTPDGNIIRRNIHFSRTGQIGELPPRRHLLVHMALWCRIDYEIHNFRPRNWYEKTSDRTFLDFKLDESGLIPAANVC